MKKLMFAMLLLAGLVTIVNPAHALSTCVQGCAAAMALANCHMLQSKRIAGPFVQNLALLAGTDARLATALQSSHALPILIFASPPVRGSDAASALEEIAGGFSASCNH